jgi:tetratricopeptide (TPR) repeat protein
MHTKLSGTFLVLLLGAHAALADTDSAQALQALKTCKEQSDISACRRAIGLGLSAKRASEAYTFWADGTASGPVIGEEPTKYLTKAIQLDPNNALAIYLLGSHMGSFNYKQAEERKRLLQKAAKLRPDWEGPHVYLGEWDKAMELAPDDPVYRANYEEAKKALDAAKGKLREMEEKAKTDPEAWSGSVVEAAKWTCDLPKAEEYAAVTEKYDTTTKTRWPTNGQRLLAQAYAFCGKYSEARQLYSKIIESFEKRLDSGLTYDEAIQVPGESLQFLDLMPETSRLNLVNATLEERAGQWTIALNYLRRAETIAPTAEIYARMARAALKGYGGANTTAVTEYVKKGLRLDPKLLEKYPEFKPYAPPEEKK